LRLQNAECASEMLLAHLSISVMLSDASSNPLFLCSAEMSSITGHWSPASIPYIGWGLHLQLLQPAAVGVCR